MESTRELWAKRVERWKDSGLTAKQFASEVGINAHSLSWWKWRLRSGSKGRPAARRSATMTIAAKSTLSPLTFVEMTAAVRNDALEVVLTTGVAIRVRPEFDARTLTRLLDVLDERR